MHPSETASAQWSTSGPVTVEAISYWCCLCTHRFAVRTDMLVTYLFGATELRLVQSSVGRSISTQVPTIVTWPTVTCHLENPTVLVHMSPSASVILFHVIKVIFRQRLFIETVLQTNWSILTILNVPKSVPLHPVFYILVWQSDSDTMLLQAASACAPSQQRALKIKKN